MKPIAKKHGVRVYNHTFPSRQVSLPGLMYLRKLEAQIPYAYTSLRQTPGKEHAFLWFVLRTGQQNLRKGSWKHYFTQRRDRVWKVWRRPLSNILGEVMDMA